MKGFAKTLLGLSLVTLLGMSVAVFYGAEIIEVGKSQLEKVSEFRQEYREAIGELESLGDLQQDINKYYKVYKELEQLDIEQRR